MIDMTNTPYIMVDLEQMEKNSRTIAQGLQAQNIKWRPHIKSHKSIFLAKKQLEWGAFAITCATLGEAAVMAEGGFSDIFIAYPLVGKTKTMRYLALHEKIATLRTLVNSIDAAKVLSETFEEAGRVAEVLIEVDGRFGRGGIKQEELLAFAKEIEKCKGLQIVGLCSYCGAQGAIKEEDARKEDAKTEAQVLINAAQLLKEAGFTIDILSSGSSVSARYPECLVGLTEVRAGTCSFNDMKHVSLGTTTQETAAVSVFATVVTLIAPGRAIVDAGSKTLTSDLSDAAGYGKVPSIGGTIVGLSEEHGFLEYPQEHQLKVGDSLEITPNHVCVVMNLADTVLGKDKDIEPFLIHIDARGMNR